MERWGGGLNYEIIKKMVKFGVKFIVLPVSKINGYRVNDDGIPN